MAKQFRVLRVLEYIGSREWVEKTLKTGSVPANGEHTFQVDGVEHSIRSATIGQFPDLFYGYDLAPNQRKFRNLLEKIKCIQVDLDNFDGDRRGIANALHLAEQELLCYLKGKEFNEADYDD